jgi:hypothetical protein
MPNNTTDEMRLILSRIRGMRINWDRHNYQVSENRLIVSVPINSSGDEHGR